MIVRAGIIFARSVLLVLFVVCLTFASPGFAASLQSTLQPAPEGCNTDVEKAQISRSEAATADDVNAEESTFDKNDTALALTCTNELAGFAADAAGGGSIFSGEFKNQRPSGGGLGLAEDISNALDTFYNATYNAFTQSEGRDDHTADGYASPVKAYYDPPAQNLSGTLNCDAIKDNWEEQIKKRGIRRHAPFSTIADMLNNNIPSGVDQPYQDNWNSENSADNNMNNYQNDLNASITNKPTLMPGYNPQGYFCNDLVAAGIAASCP